MSINTEDKRGVPINPSQRPQTAEAPTKPEELREGEFRNADAGDAAPFDYDYEVEQEETVATEHNEKDNNTVDENK